jgi:hypothetical protein
LVFNEAQILFDVFVISDVLSGARLSLPAAEKELLVDALAVARPSMPVEGVLDKAWKKEVP